MGEFGVDRGDGVLAGNRQYGAERSGHAETVEDAPGFQRPQFSRPLLILVFGVGQVIEQEAQRHLTTEHAGP
ncbi:hypothetical protein [Nonomuraea sp. KM90]|uniref:hypothetical protein n=1 Tax=Nonomuraea sp. KM90 TaxID=3457428 RepID=UPI003FCE7E9B